MSKKNLSEESQPWLPLLVKGVVCNNTQFPDNVVPLAIDMSKDLVRVTLTLPHNRTFGNNMDTIDLVILGEDSPENRHRNTITLLDDNHDFILGVRWIPREGQTYYKITSAMTIEKVECKMLFSEKPLFECENCFSTEAEAQKFALHFRDLLTTSVL